MTTSKKSMGLTISLASLLALVACVALNIWLFRLGALIGMSGLYITKHVVIAYLCRILGVNKKTARSSSNTSPSPSTVSGLHVP